MAPINKERTWLELVEWVSAACGTQWELGTHNYLSEAATWQM